MKADNVAGDPVAVRLARLVVELGAASFPKQGRDMAVDAMTDCVACALAGVNEPLVGPLLAVTPTVRSNMSGQAPLIGLARAASPEHAALVNGTLAHALDYDDISHPACVHPSAVLLPALLAGASAREMSGRDVVSAFIIGIEVFGKLGRCFNPEHYGRGWHATGTFGAIAAAAATAAAFNLGLAETVNAISIAASSACGLRANFGTMTKPLHAGMAARNGLYAALLASNGFDANASIFEHAAGFAATFNGGQGIDWDVLDAKDDLEIVSEYGLALKPYPSCGATHPGIEAALILRDRLRHVSLDAIHGVKAGVSKYALGPLIYSDPRTPLEAKFSLEFCIATALVDGRVDLATFSQDRLKDPSIQQLRRKVSLRVDPRVANSTEFATAVAVEFGHGEQAEELVPIAIGKPERWFPKDALQRKFVDCVAWGRWAPDRSVADRLFEMMQRIDSDRPAAATAADLMDPRHPSMA